MGWRDILSQLATNAEERFDVLKQRMDQRFGNEPIVIVPYYGYGTPTHLSISGRVLEETGVRESQDNDTIWRNMANMYRRFTTDEVTGARVLAEANGQVLEVTTNDEGYFFVHMPLDQPLPPETTHVDVRLTLLSPLPQADEAPQATGRVFVMSNSTEYGIISDIDDTVLQTGATSLLKMARTVFLGNARTRLPFPGVAALYRALQLGANGQPTNPLFYVSSSPWNLYDLLIDFFQLQQIPAGPLMLRDWGFGGDGVPLNHQTHKVAAIRQILDTLPNLPFLLMGDSGQEDPEIYAEVVRLYPGRIKAAYIRNVSQNNAGRTDAIRTLATELAQTGGVMVLADDTPTMANHAATHGWLAPEELAMVVEEKHEDEQREEPSLLDDGDSEENTQ